MSVTSSDSLSRIEAWFAERAWSPFEFQRETWRAQMDGMSGLVHAPTGLGKTYAVWMGLLARALREEDADRTIPAPLRVLWLTPLRALANDTVNALAAPLEPLGVNWTVEKRTGDTTASARKRQRERLPSALVTTPESLSLLISYADHAERFKGIRAVIVDEWHELLGTKRGVQAELGLARLRAINPDLQIWGLSATLGNLEEAMHTLLGPTLAPRGRLIHGAEPKRIEIETLIPERIERFPWSGHLGTRLLQPVIERIERAKTTLLFTNTRSHTEIWFASILRARPDWIGEVALHHGSLDRELRSEVESMIDLGRMRCVVCTSSLDLGVDFSPVDQIIQVGSPKGVARLMQRAGRSGHQPGAVSRIIGVPTNALELVEFAAARTAMESRLIEQREPIRKPLDVLVQHLVTLALGGGFEREPARQEIMRAAAYAELSDAEWQWAMDFVTRGGQALDAYPDFKRVVERDGRCFVDSQKIARRHRMAVGTITSESAMLVRMVGGRTLGSIEESFIARLRPGNQFMFAGRMVELVRVREMTAQVKRATKRTNLVPRWGGGRMPLSSELAGEVRRHLALAQEERESAHPEIDAVRPILDVQAAWSRLPRPGELVIERLKTREGHHAFVYTLEGRLVHEGLAALAAHRLTRLQPCSVICAMNDWGFELLSNQPMPVDADSWRQLFSPDHLADDLVACLNTSEMARRQFREIARVAGLIFAGYPGQPKSNRHLQASSELFYEVFTEFDPTNLLLEQSRREVLERQLEGTRLRRALETIREIEIHLTEPPRLTPLAFSLWTDRLRDQISSESWSDRVQRMIVRLEKAAGETRF
ncbi:MAG: ligase-associated DNA damage response DEXH box helicase [Phycisphaerales bacterium]|nr:MAG: ligase-associated DNA damage response DEXH box helicase [Phycisphaerales bacterium]